MDDWKLNAKYKHNSNKKSRKSAGIKHNHRYEPPSVACQHPLAGSLIGNRSTGTQA